MEDIEHVLLGTEVGTDEQDCTWIGGPGGGRLDVLEDALRRECCVGTWLVPAAP